MQVKKITPFKFNTKSLKTSINSNNTFNNSNAVPVNTLNAENIRANFLPSFGKFRKIADVMLKDKVSGYDIPAVLKREDITKDDFNYKLFVRDKEAGYMTLYCNSLVPEDEGIAPVRNNIFPEVHYLRSLMGDKYSGIGSALIKAAIMESEKRGHGGALWLISDKNFAYSESPYRSNQNPIPFYYKLGFRSINKFEDIWIPYYISHNQYDELPDSSVLVLTEEAAHADNKYLARNFTVN